MQRVHKLFCLDVGVIFLMKIRVVLLWDRAMMTMTVRSGGVVSPSFVLYDALSVVGCVIMMFMSFPTF